MGLVLRLSLLTHLLSMLSSKNSLISFFFLIFLVCFLWLIIFFFFFSSNRFVGVIGKLSGIPQPKTSDCWKNPYFSSQIQTREKRFTLSPEVLKLVVPQVDLFLRHIHNFSDRIVTFLQVFSSVSF